MNEQYYNIRMTPEEMREVVELGFLNADSFVVHLSASRLRELDDVVFTMLECIDENTTDPEEKDRENFLQGLRSTLMIPCASCNPQDSTLDGSDTAFITGAQIRMLIEFFQDATKASGDEEYRDIRTVLEQFESLLEAAAEPD